MKKSIYFLGVLFLMLFMASCLNNKDDNKTVISDEAVITSFYLYSDSVKTIDDYHFTIDNDSMLIYNYDSIDYGIEVDSMSFVLNPRFHKVYINDTLDYYAMSDVHLDFTKEVKFTVVASDEVTSADYRVMVNVHQVDPDTFIWNSINNKVFDGNALSSKAVYVNEKLLYLAMVDGKLVVNESVDGAIWTSITPAGLDASDLNLNELVANDDYIYAEVAGKVYQSADGAVWTEVEASGADVERLLFVMDGKVYGVVAPNKIARLVDGIWTELGELPAGFPVEGGAVLVADAPSGKERVFVVGGVDAEGKYLSTVWSSEDGAYWSELTSGKELFAPRAYAAVTQYGGGLMLFGGRVDETGTVTEDAQLFSKDYGLTWGEPKAKSAIDSLYTPRYEHSAVVTSEGYIYLVGGRVSTEGNINDVWRGLNYASLPGFRK